MDKREATVAWQCQGKTAYLSYSDAAHSLRRKRDKDGGFFMNVYRCRHCNRWHIGGCASKKKENADYRKQRASLFYDES